MIWAFYLTFFIIEFICMVIFYFIMDKLTQYKFFDKGFGAATYTTRIFCIRRHTYTNNGLDNYIIKLVLALMITGN